MIVLFVVLIFLITAILFLKGVGGSYGRGGNFSGKKRSFDNNPKNFFL